MGLTQARSTHRSRAERLLAQAAQHKADRDEATDEEQPSADAKEGGNS